MVNNRRRKDTARGVVLATRISGVSVVSWGRYTTLNTLTIGSLIFRNGED